MMPFEATIRIFLLAMALIVVPARSGQKLESHFFPSPELRVQTRWLVPLSRPGGDPALGSMMVAESPFTELRLMVPQSYVGKRVRIDALLPAFAQGVEGSRGLKVEWRTQGVFRPGKLHMGERVPFFEGVVNGTTLSDRVAYVIHMDARYASGPIRFETIYEIEESR